VAAVLVSACGSDDKKAVPAAGSRLDEACEKTADCAAGLACVVSDTGSVCRPVSSGITVNAKECAAIQCNTADDCCTNQFTRNSQCTTWAANCTATPTSADCARSTGPQCVCTAANYTCDKNVCHGIQCQRPTDCCTYLNWTRSTACDTAAADCTTDPVLYASQCTYAQGTSCVCNDTVNNYDCNAQNLCVTVTSCTSDTSCYAPNPRCDTAAGHCVGCLTTADCTASGAQCIANVCVTPTCKSNADCVAFSACEKGANGLNACVPKGCANNQECMTFEENYLATCFTPPAPTLPYCVVQCDTDAQCATANNPLRKCVVTTGPHGTCQDPGCTTDEECKIRLELVSQLPAGTQAVCRDKPATPATTP
jgi:hypothetical protein